MKTKSKDLVVHHNYLNESIFNFNELELNLFIVIIYKMRKESDSTVVFKAQDIKKMVNAKDRSYKKFENIIHSLQDRTIYLKTVSGYKRIKPFPTLEFDNINKTVEVEINKNIIPLFRELKEQFTQYSLKEFLSLKSKHSKRLYQLLKQYEKIGYRSIGVEDLKKFLECDTESYSRMYNFEKRVLETAEKDINMNTSISVRYDKVKNGRKVDNIKFFIKKTTKNDNKNVDNNILLESNETENKINVEKDTTPNDKTTKNDKLEKAILKAKRNIYVSKAWNKRTDNKLDKLIKDHGEEYTIDILNRLYEGAKQEIKTTLVQYINGIIKNVKLELEDKKEYSKKITTPKVEVKKDVALVLDEKKLMSFDEFNQMDNQQREKLEKVAIKHLKEKEGITSKFLLDLKKKSLNLYFKTIRPYILTEA